MSNWNFADVWEAVAGRFPAALALRHADRQVSWRDFDERANGVAASLLAAGLGHQDKVAQYMRNRPEYVETVAACYRARLTDVNVNYRYIWRRAMMVGPTRDGRSLLVQILGTGQ